MRRPDLRIRVQLTVSVVLFTLICLVSLAVAITTLSDHTLLDLQRGNLDLNCRMLREECSQDIENMYDTFYRMIYSVPIKNIYQPDASFDTLTQSVTLLSESFNPNRVIQLRLYDGNASGFLRINGFKSYQADFPDDLYPLDEFQDDQTKNATLEAVIRNTGLIMGPIKTNVTLGGTKYMMSITLPIHNGGHYLSTGSGDDDVTGYGTFIFSALKIESVLSTVSLSSSQSQIGSASLCAVSDDFTTFQQLIPFNDSTIIDDYSLVGNISTTTLPASAAKQYGLFNFSDDFPVPLKMQDDLRNSVLPSAILNKGPKNSMISVAQFGILSSNYYVVVLQSHKGVYEMSDALRDSVIISSCAIAAAMVVFTFLFVSFGARQILRLKMAATYETPAKSRWGFIPIPWWLRPANKVRTKGKNEYLVPDKVPLRKHVRDELDDITERFNTISTELTKQYDKLERRVKDRKAEIEQAREAADLANAAKSHFLARVTHELRTPLNGIIGSASLCLEEDDIDKVHESLGTIFKCGELLLHLMTDLLSFSQNEVENLSIELRDFKMSEITSQLTAIFTEQCSVKKINLQVNSSPKLEHMVFSGDTNRILQVIFNLMSNGIKFTPPDGTVCFSADIGEPNMNPNEINLVFRVRDNGPGIALEMQHKVFEAFVQGDISTQIKKAGVGLGLSICRQLAERMRGTIILKSKLNEGSMFVFTLPIAYRYGCDSSDSLDMSSANSVIRSSKSTPPMNNGDMPTPSSFNNEYTPESTKSDMFLTRTISTASVKVKARDFKRRLTQDSVSKRNLKGIKDTEREKDKEEDTDKDGEKEREREKDKEKPFNINSINKSNNSSNVNNSSNSNSNSNSISNTISRSISHPLLIHSEKDKNALHDSKELAKTNSHNTVHEHDRDVDKKDKSKDKSKDKTRDKVKERAKDKFRDKFRDKSKDSHDSKSNESKSDEKDSNDRPNSQHIEHVDHLQPPREGTQLQSPFVPTPPATQLVRPSTALQRRLSESAEIRQALRREESENYFNFQHPVTTQTGMTPNLSTPKLANDHLHVLVVDDNNVNQEVIVRMLKLEGVKEIEVAGDGIIAVEKTRDAEVNHNPFHVIFMDVQMPRMDGRQATKVIRSELHSNVRIVAVSAFADDRNAQECIEAGMNLFLSKPLRRPHLRDILRGLSED